MRFTLRELKELNVEKEINGKWVPARPINWELKNRLKEAYDVLVGKADSFVWPENQ